MGTYLNLPNLAITNDIINLLEKLLESNICYFCKKEQMMDNDKQDIDNYLSKFVDKEIV